MSTYSERKAMRVLDEDGRPIATHLHPEQHGTHSAVTYWGCRCETCYHLLDRRGTAHSMRREMATAMNEAAARRGEAITYSTPNSPTPDPPAKPQAKTNAPTHDEWAQLNQILTSALKAYRS